MANIWLSMPLRVNRDNGIAGTIALRLRAMVGTGADQVFDGGGYTIMLGLVVKGAKAVIKEMEKDAKQLRFAAHTALNKTAQQAKKDVDKELKRAFKNPTPFIKRSLRVEYSPKSERKSKGEMNAGVGFKDVFDKSGTAVERTLLPHIKGGPRLPKPSEKMLRRAGILSSNEYLVPSRTAPLNAYGNIRGGIMQKILSDLAAHTSAGYTANRKGKAYKRKGKAQYVLGQVGSTKGIFQIAGGAHRMATGRWKLIFLVVKGVPTYKARFKFYEVAERSFLKHIDREFDKAYRQAVETAR